VRLSASALAGVAEGVLIPPFRGGTAPAWLLAALDRGLAGVTIFSPNVQAPDQLAALTSRLRSAAAEPLIAVDEEGGDVTRIYHRTGSPYPGNAALGVVDDTGVTAGIYRWLGADLAAAGINLNLAPSVDVNSAAGNPVIGTRSFGADTALVTRHAAAAVSGLQSAGVAACAKHFPGHGSTSADSHLAVAEVDGDLEQLRRRDLPPFAAAIAAGTRAVMTGHLVVRGLTGGRPTTWSAAALTGLLRGELGFTGVIVTDALEMRALRDTGGLPEAGVRAVAAGADLLCLGRDQDEQAYLATRAALAAAVCEDRIPVRRLEEAAGRVAELRAWLARQGGTGPRDGKLPYAERADGERADGERAGLEAARRALRVFGLRRPLIDPVVVELRATMNVAVAGAAWGLGPWLSGGAARLDPGASGAERDRGIERVLAAAAGRSLVIVVRDAHRHPAARAASTALLTARPDAVVVEMGLPVWRPPGAAYLATYGAARANCQAVAQALGLGPDPADVAMGTP
jgi:beta-glucosidase-like glycosyl hydrolase